MLRDNQDENVATIKVRKPESRAWLSRATPSFRWGYRQPDVLPVTVVIGPDGELRQELRGPQTLEDLLAASGGPQLR